MARMRAPLRPALLAAVALLLVTAHSRPTAGQPAESSPATRFLEALSGLCGQAFAGRIVANEPAQPDDPFVGRPLVAHVRVCEPGRVLVPLHVGDDRSRTWVLTLHGDRLRLKHDHRHRDGTEDVLTQYGGDAVTAGSATRQEFPVDAFSKDLFTRQGRSVSTTNTWAMEVHPGRVLAYELTRPGRRFRIEFDLQTSVPAPPAPWGHR
jgi:hypothetical protein